MEKSKKYNLPAKTDDWVDNFVAHIDGCIRSCTAGKERAIPHEPEVWQAMVNVCKYFKNRVVKGNLMGIEERMNT